ncbi:uncharacterized protein LOC129709577 [Leucoraja erinacea]|uniref:uncharacterized protein LOC129709577 n=1 Tax=Leucoraja erinaceus TaxID=7782 RepID=UPI002458B908|nr:uncharacterized protein LOC129709577 [Leucoraja erinacea]
MSLWCGIVFVVTASFSLNVLYHDLFPNGPRSNSMPKCLLGSIHQPVRNGAVSRDVSLEIASPPPFTLHRPFTALLPAKQALEVHVEVKQEEPRTEPDLEQCMETALAVMETGLTIIETRLSVVQTIKIIRFWIIEEIEDEDVSEVTSLGEPEDMAAIDESAPTETEFHTAQPKFPFYQEHDVLIVLVAHLTLVIAVLLLGGRCLHVQKGVTFSDVDVDELIVTVGLVSCITVALFALLGATIILFIRILLTKFP